MYPNPMPPSYPRPQPGALAAPSPIPTRPITPIDPSIVHSQRPEPTTDPRNQRWSRGDITSFLGQLGNHAEQAQEAGYINSVPAWLRNDRMPPGGLSPEWVDRLQMWKGRLQDMGLPYEQPVEMAEGGEVTNYADKVRKIIQGRSNPTPEARTPPRMSGEVYGGSGERDDVPALLQGSAGPGDPGEFVLNKGAVINLGLDFLNKQNSRGLEVMAPPSSAPQINVPQMWAGGRVEDPWAEPSPIPYDTSGNMSSWGNYNDMKNRLGSGAGSRPSSYWGTNPPGNQSMYPTSWKYYSQYGWVPHAQGASGFGGSGAEYTTGGGFNPLAGAGFGSSTFMGGQLGGFNSTGDIPRQLKGI